MRVTELVKEAAKGVYFRGYQKDYLMGYLMNKLNTKFLFIEIFLVIIWYLFMQGHIKEILLLLLFLNLMKIFLLTLYKLLSKGTKPSKSQ